MIRRQASWFGHILLSMPMSCSLLLSSSYPPSAMFNVAVDIGIFALSIPQLLAYLSHWGKQRRCIFVPPTSSLSIFFISLLTTHLYIIIH